MSSYAGDMDPQTVWDRLSATPDAVLIDVRSHAEWSFVGMPDLSSLGRQVVLAEWAVFPDMVPDVDFVPRLTAQLDDMGIDRRAPLFFLCRSGARSRYAAIAMTANGFAQCFNVSEGFEGDLNNLGQRGQVNGWKWRELPWRQS